MYDNAAFQKLVSASNPTGEVISSDRFLVKVKGLDGVGLGALVLFESGQQAMVREVDSDYVLLLNLESENTEIGSLVVLQDKSLTTGVGEALIGRVVTPLGKPLDDKGPITFTQTWPVYNRAPGIIDRKILQDQLATGVTIVDTLFPIVLGQRIAIMGDSKSGKTSLMQQIGNNQVNTDRVVVYVFIGKRRSEVDSFVANLTQTGAINNSIIVVADIFDSLTQSYLAPYIGVSIAEYLWQSGRDVVIIYDDLTSHAKVYREVSLLSNVNPGRDSYPGDMFYAHSSLLERAGRLSSNSKTLTALPVIITPNDDITAYLPTSIMSITDGQIVLDLNTFRQNIKPAVNAGLSVSRVGGRAQTLRRKNLSVNLFKKLADYRQAAEFAHFGSDMTSESQQLIQLGKSINEAFRQAKHELFSLNEQQIMLEVILAAGGQKPLDVTYLKKRVKELGPMVTDDASADATVTQLLTELTGGGAI